MSGQLLKLLLQAAYFIIIARVLGSQAYGAFVSIAAAVAIVNPFSGMGTGILMVKHASRDRALLPIWWGTTLLMTTISGIGLVLLVTLLTPLLFPSVRSLTLVLLIAVSDLLLAKYTEAAMQAFWASGRLAMSARIEVLAVLFRTIAAALLFLLP